MLAITLYQNHIKVLAVQAQRLEERLKHMSINKRREHLRQASILAGHQSKRRSEEFAIHMQGIIKKLYGARQPNIKRVVELLNQNDHKTIHGKLFSESALYLVIRKIHFLKGKQSWLEK